MADTCDFATQLPPARPRHGLSARAAVRLAVIVPVAALCATAAAPASAAGGSGPIAVVAFGPHGGTESISQNIPGPGDGAVQTDQLPADATQATISLTPTTSVVQEPTFNDLVDTVITNYPQFAKVNRTAQRIISCAIIAALNGAMDVNKEGDFVFTAKDPTIEALTLQMCLQIALNISTPASGASTASAACIRADRSIAIKLTRTHSGYSEQVNAFTHKPTRRSPIAVTCQRTATGLKFTIRPRARGRTLRQAVGPNLGIAFVNPTHASLGVHTTFTVH